MRNSNPIRRAKSVYLPLWASALVSVAAIHSTSAWAYFSGKVEVDGAELKQQPRANAPTIKSLPKGTAFNASDRATNGYYYIRTVTDLGWIDGASIGKDKLSSTEPAHAPVAQAKPQNAASPSQQKKSRPTRKQTRIARPIMIKAHADYNIFSVSDLNDATKSSSFGNALGYGVEAMWFFNPLTAVGFRFDSISQKVAATDTTNSNVYEFNLSTSAFMLGIERILWADSSFYVAANGYLGIANPKLTANVTASSGTTSYQYSGKPLTLLALFEGGWKINPTFGLYGELGYRLLKSSSVSATGGDVSGTILPATASLNFSGPVIGFGVSARF